jgi:putative CocE/NonD family hydrolase
VFIYNTGENHWDRLDKWPLAAASKALYLQPGFGLGFEKPTASGADTYVSDPAKPVPYLPRPVRFSDSPRWQTWLVSDQRAVADRPDVLVYQTPELKAPVRVSGMPIADLQAATTGTDADWVVKLIDVYPDEVPSQPELGGYQLAIAMDIFRGRYRESFEHPTAIPAGKPQRYRFTLPTTNHVFLPGHRIMVQIQSSWFPLYDRNPQTFVPNIFYAKPTDYVKATLSVFHSADQASAVWLPVI